MSNQPLSIFWEGGFATGSSFARINRSCGEIFARDTNIDLSIVMTEPVQEGFEEALSSELADCDLKKNPTALARLRADHSFWISHRYPPRKDPPPRRPRWASIFPWEYSIVPETLLDSLDAAPEIWVPSHFSSEALIHSGMAAEKVVVIENGFDPKLYVPDGPTLDLGGPDQFRFLFVGGTIPRKGIDILLECFENVFPPGTKEADLYIKEAGNLDLYRNQDASKQLREKSSDPDSNLHYLTDPMTDREMASLYRSCDVLVAPYRGEGFCLPALEATACGLPVIATRGGPTSEFLPEISRWEIDASETSVGTSIYGMECRDEAFWFEPDKEHLETLLRQAFEQSLEDRQARGRKGSASVHERFTWEHVVGKIQDRIQSTGIA